MRPPVGSPPIEVSKAEHALIKRMRRAKLFVFLRQHRHELFGDALQQELATLYHASPQGQPPVPPAQLALATIVQAYTQGSDDEVIDATVMDRRWPLVLDCLDGEKAPFSKAPLVAFRQRLIAPQMDRRLLERPVEIAAASGAVGPGQWRAALDSSPLWGAGRVEDPYNLLGHALRTALGVIARQQGRGLAEVAAAAAASLVAQASVKAALDRDWDAPEAQAHALRQVLDVLARVASWLDTPGTPVEAAATVAATMAIAQQGRAQDVSTAPDGTPRLRQGVAKDRRMSVEDAEMRHGRKSRSLLVDGYKRHVLRDLDSRLIVAVGITPANAPEASGTDALEEDLAAQHPTLKALHIDRAYLASTLVQQRAEDLAIFCKAWPVRRGAYFPQSAFALDWQRKELRGPGGETMPFEPGGVGKLPAATGMRCGWRERCTKSASGRRVSMHPDDAWWQERRERQQTPEGRAKLRERVAVEHALSHVGPWQGRRARSRGGRKNGFDLRRCAVVHNLHVLMRLPQTERSAA
jgi:transposase